MASAVQLLTRPDKGRNVRVQAPPGATYPITSTTIVM
jgi:hypothetical protein